MLRLYIYKKWLKLHLVTQLYIEGFSLPPLQGSTRACLLGIPPSCKLEASWIKGDFSSSLEDRARCLRFEVQVVPRQLVVIVPLHFWLRFTTWMEVSFALMYIGDVRKICAEFVGRFSIRKFCYNKWLTTKCISYNLS